MKILHVIPTLSPRYGGPAKVCSEMASRLVAAGHQAAVFTTNRDYPAGIMDVPTGRVVDNEGVPTTYFPVEVPGLLISRGIAVALSREVANFDIVHIHGLYRFPLAAAAWYARRHGVPYVIRPHGSLDPVQFYKRERRAMKRIYETLVEFPNMNRAALIHYTTEDEMRRAEFLKFRAPAIVVPNGVAIEAFRALPPPGLFREKYGLGAAKVIMHLGRVDPVKALPLLVTAFADVARVRNDVRLAIVGPDIGGHAGVLRTQLAQLGVEDRAVFTGMLEGDDKLAAMRDADIFVLPSYTENFGLAVVEAMAAGLPVIVSDQVKIWREVQGAGAGLVTACDPGEIATALRALLDAPQRRRDLGKAGRALVEQRFAWNVVIDQLVARFRSVLAGRTGPTLLRPPERQEQ